MPGNGEPLGDPFWKIVGAAMVLGGGVLAAMLEGPGPGRPNE